MEIKPSEKQLKTFFKKYGLPAVILLALSYTFWKKDDPTKSEVTLSSSDVGQSELGALNIPAPKNLYGFKESEFKVYKDSIRSGDILGSLLTKHNVSYNKVLELVDRSKDIFDIKTLGLNKPYVFLSDPEKDTASYFIYEPNKIEYVVCHLGDSVYMEKFAKQVDTVRMVAKVEIESSLWNAIMENNLAESFTPAIVSKMEEAFAWSVDLLHLQKGDRSKFIYDQYWVDGELVAIGNMHAGYFYSGGREHYAFRYNDEFGGGFYNEKGEPLKGAFLRAPIRASDVFRVSSRYTMKRFHPVLKYNRPHLGTDFAAPHGTPIVATADGTVEKRGYTKGNGNYVKIRHDKTYSTQYLHMSKFNNQFKVGSAVRQGDVIGYVGSTGLATGPHVCYRFWKNGVQVDPFRENLPSPEPLPLEDLENFYKIRDYFQNRLNEIEWRDPNQKQLADVSEEPKSEENQQQRHSL